MPGQNLSEKKGAGAGAAGSRRTLFSADLFRGFREITIEHCGQHYRLQITKAGKLILNK